MVFKLHKPILHTKLTKLTIGVLVLVAVSVGLLALAGATYTRYQAQVEATNKQHQAELQAAKTAGYKEGTKDRLKYQAAYELMAAECQKGAKNYGLLTTSQKRTAQAVNCNQPVLQFP